MPQTCTKCSRINPDEADYCYYDGSALGGHRVNGGPIHSGSQPFPHQFVFPSGRVCRDFDQLALAIQENWQETLELLSQGFLEAFLGGTGRTDLALAARESAHNPDQDRGLDDLLGKLPTTVLRPPQLAVEPTEVNLGQLSGRTNRRFDLHLYNQGTRLLYGSVACETGVWLALGDAPGSPQKVFQFSSESVVPVQVRGQYLQASNKPLEGKLSIESNGGRAVVSIRAEVPAQPFAEGVLAGAKSPRQAAEKAKAHPKEAAPLFQNGAVAAWYKENGWTYPVQGPVATGVGAVQQFFEALGLTPPPRVEISPPSVALYGQPAEPARFTLQVKTQENRPVYAHATSDQPWLWAEQAKLEGRSATIPFVVPQVPDCEGDILKATVTVTANGNQRFFVPVTLEVGSHFRFREADSARDDNSGTASPPSTFEFDAPAEEQGSEVQDVETLPAEQRPRTRRFHVNLRQMRHIVPAAILGLALLLVMIWDLVSPRKAIQPKDISKRSDARLVGFDPNLEVNFMPEKRRFGINLIKEPDPNDPGKVKRLTSEPAGATNNTCVKIGDTEYLFGQRPGTWAFDPEKKRRLELVEVVKGQKWLSVMDFGDIRVTQIVAVLPNERTLKFDVCLVQYLMENRSNHPQDVGVRVMLNVMNGTGASFQASGGNALGLLADFKQDDIPDYIQVSERSDPQDPGTVAQIGLKLPGLKMTEGDPELDRIERVVVCQFDSRDVRWGWDFKPMEQDPSKRNPCVLIYGPVQSLPPGGKRAMAFTYGLGRATSINGGDIGLAVDSLAIRPNQEFTVTANIPDLDPSDILRMHLPEDAGFSLLPGQEEGRIVPKGTSRFSWTVRAGEAGAYRFVVTAGLKRGDLEVKIRKPSGFR